MILSRNGEYFFLKIILWGRFDFLSYQAYNMGGL